MNRFVILFLFCCIVAVAQCTSYCRERLTNDEVHGIHQNKTLLDDDPLVACLIRHMLEPPLVVWTLRRRSFLRLGDFVCTPSRESITEDEEDYVTFPLLMDFPDTTNYSELSIRTPSREDRRRMLIGESCWERGSPSLPPDVEQLNNTMASAGLMHANPLIGPSLFQVPNETTDSPVADSGFETLYFQA
jgi:hypothetical protein